jgi:hypothetical protein
MTEENWFTLIALIMFGNIVYRCVKYYSLYFKLIHANSVKDNLRIKSFKKYDKNTPEFDKLKRAKISMYVWVFASFFIGLFGMFIWKVIL